MRTKGKARYHSDAANLETAKRDAAMLALYCLGVPIKQISFLCDCHQSLPAVTAKRYGLPRRGNAPMQKTH